MAITKLKYKVWMGFKNYRGEITDECIVAAFCSKERALAYIDLTLWWEAEDHERYAYGLYVGNTKYHITPLEEGINGEERSKIK